VGVSTSGSFVVVGVALFLAMSSMYGTYTNTMERMDESMEMAQERRLATAHTAIEVSEATLDSGNLSVEVNNTGETTLDVGDTSVLVDGEYASLSAFENQRIAELNASRTRSVGDPATAKLRPGETLNLTDTSETYSGSNRVKVVVEYGIADTKLVS
jgi:archaellum component FlaF (FlaF/FlaG flagellin family)